jgi:hypothetical protein
MVIAEAMREFKAGMCPQPVFFYCSRNPAELSRSDPQKILASLARQLSCPAPGAALLRPLLDIYKEDEDTGFASGSPQVKDSSALILKLLDNYPMTTIVIDAMDECDPLKRIELLSSLEMFLRESASLIKIFITSRDDQDLRIQLQGYPNLVLDH